MQAIVKGAGIENAVRLLSRHATPRAFTHVCLSGVAGRGFLAAVDPAAVGLFVFSHPTLGDWGAVPAQFKRLDGGVGHAFAGITPDMPGPPLSAADFAGLTAVELYVLGHLRRWCNGRTRAGAEFLALVTDHPALVDAVKPALVAWRSDTATWDAAPAEYKRASGAPLVDPTTVRETTLVDLNPPTVGPIP